MNLPDGYFTRAQENRRILCEAEAVYRIVPEGYGQVLEYDHRTVAGFPKDAPMLVIREIARLDKQSRNEAIAPVERQDALEDLARKFLGERS